MAEARFCKMPSKTSSEKLFVKMKKQANKQTFQVTYFAKSVTFTR
jgi:hypothetical protein